MQNEMSKRLDDLEETLIDEVQEDSRMSSGSGADASEGDLDFIKMTGLTTPSSMESVAEVSPEEPVEDMNPEAPISFFEKGLEDVDGAMVPDGTLESLGEEEELVASTVTSDGQGSSIEGLKEIIADLAGETESTDQMPEEPEPPTDLEADVVSEEITEEQLAELNMEATQNALENFEVSEPKDIEEPSEVVEIPEVVDVVVEETSPLQVLPSLDDDEDFEDEDDAERDSTIYTRPLRSKNQSRNRRRRTPAGFFIQFSFMSTLFLLILGGIYYSLELFADRNLSAPQMMAKAQAAMDEREYAEAGQLFDEIQVRFPADPLVGESKFMAAYAFQLIPDTTNGSAEYYENSISRFERFLAEDPKHLKATRAETLLGMLYYRMGNYEKAVAILADPNRRKKDSGAYLTTLRTLARSYAATSRIQESHTAFLRAATLDGNMAPEEDYLELARLYEKLGRMTASEVMATRYNSLAIEQWDNAIEVPGILSYLRNEIQLVREDMIQQLAQAKLTERNGKYESLSADALRDDSSE